MKIAREVLLEILDYIDYQQIPLRIAQTIDALQENLELNREVRIVSLSSMSANHEDARKQLKQSYDASYEAALARMIAEQQPE